MIRKLSFPLLTLAAVLLLSGCIGWMAHPGYGPHHRWNDDGEGRPYGPGTRCTEEERASGERPCPYYR